MSRLGCSGERVGARLSGGDASPVCVCVPARDEAEHLPDLIGALGRQLGAPPFTLCLFLDGATDGSEALVRRLAADAGVRLAMRVGPADAAPNAGRARRAALALGLARLAGKGGALLTTDADSAPAPDWVASACSALEGADLVAGRIVRRSAPGAPGSALDVQARVEAYYDRLYRHRRRLDPLPWEVGPVHHQTGGANLAVRAQVYAALGGFALAPSGEDALLVDAAHRAGFRVRRDPAVVVRTSARTTGRAPDGLAAALRRGGEADALGAVRVAHPADEVWRYARHAAARAAFDPRLEPERAAALAGLWGGCPEDLRRAASAAPNAEAFATRVVPTAPGGARTVGLPEAERALDGLERACEPVAA